LYRYIKVAAPRRVEKIHVNYARTTKVVDVKELKTTLWESLNDPAVSAPDAATGAHSFHALLSNFPEDNAAGATKDISVHMVGLYKCLRKCLHACLLKCLHKCLRKLKQHHVFMIFRTRA
jgi:hypothetical protein